MQDQEPSPSFRLLFATFGRIGVLSFGGPAAQISLMHSELVDRHKWLSDKQFMGALSFCMLLPGPEAMQLATYSGWRLRGTLGGLLAGGLFVLPGAILIMLLAYGYLAYRDLPLVQKAFIGVKSAVIIIVLQAIVNMSKKAIKRRSDWIVSALAFTAIFALGLPFPLIVLAAGVWGFYSPQPIAHQAIGHWPNSQNTLKTVTLWGTLWACPLLLAYATNNDFLFDLGMFFSKLAIVTFGGAYAVISYLTQVVVNDFNWLAIEAMMDALGLAETTPGPLILVTQFVAALAGAKFGMTTLAALMALWTTFIPCFLWIFAGAPYVEWIMTRPRLRGALAAITAAALGLIANLGLWFALHLFFDIAATSWKSPVTILQSFNMLEAGLALISALLLFTFRLGIPKTLAIMAAVACVI